MTIKEIVGSTAGEAGFHRVGSVNGLENGARLTASIGDTPVAVFVLNGSYIAIRDSCPHAGGPLHEGELEGTILTCPWHGLGYDINSGECQDDPCLNLVRYDVRIEGEDILVRI